MIRIDRAARSRLLASSLALAAVLALTSTKANAGFLDQLFGGGLGPSQPSFGHQPQQPSPDFNYQPIRPRQKKVLVFHEETPVRQKTTDLWHDKTLRFGDAIMMKDGMHVFRGPSASIHMAKEFVPVDHARHVSPTERSALLALDTTRNDPLRGGYKPDSIASGRSAAVATPISEGVRITDARGASVRYVGP